MAEELRKDVLTLLNKHFRTAVLEKHPQAIIQLLVDDAWDHVCGPDYDKIRVSKRDRVRIKDYILKQLRYRYGKWITVVRFDKKFNFSTNFEFVYKTEHGRLYGNPPDSIFHDVFFTSHSLEQFDNRVASEKLRDFSLVFKRRFGTEPTAADVILSFVLFILQFGLHDNFIYLNVNYGILVMEVIDRELFIVKTFLAPDMIDPCVRWYDLSDDHCGPRFRIKDLLGDIRKISRPIGKPVFELPEYDYSFFTGLLERVLT